jgi:hypothetical protein
VRGPLITRPHIVTVVQCLILHPIASLHGSIVHFPARQMKLCIGQLSLGFFASIETLL